MNKLLFLILLIISLTSCVQESSTPQTNEEDSLAKIDEIVSEMDIITNPEILIFNNSDSISIIIDCQHKDSALCCGYGEIHYLIDDTLEVDRIYEDTTYNYNHCWCGDTINLPKLKEGEHFIDGNFFWHKGDWSLAKKWNKKITIN